MRADTQSITLPTGREEAFAFLANPANLPHWAVGFARSIRSDGDRWIVETGGGEVPVHFRTDQETGVIDFVMAPAPDLEVVAHSRVLDNGDGSEYVFTQFQAPGMTDQVFAAQVVALRHELELLRARFAAAAACPAER